MPSLAEAITASFYAWESRGRGWTLADYPVSLEPPHRPFFLLPEFRAENNGSIDDGKRPTFLSALIEGTKRVVSRERKAPVAAEPFEEDPPFPVGPRSPIVALSLSIPPDFEYKGKLAERLLLTLSATREPVSFELIGCKGEVSLQVVAGENDREHLIESIRSFAPEVVVREREDRLREVWADGTTRSVVDFGLANEFFLPIATLDPASLDPYLSLIPALAAARSDEILCLQVLIEQVRNPWAKTISAAVFDPEGESIFSDAPEFPTLASEKLASPLLAVMIRVAASAVTRERTSALLRNLEAFFVQFTRPLGNALIPLPNDGYDDDAHESAVAERQTFRTGMLLSVEELVGMVHLPQAAVAHPALLREIGTTRAAPRETEGERYVLGENVHRGERKLIALAEESRLKHLHIVGATGTGKSTLLSNLLLEDIEHGEGMLLLDPHGDLVDDILGRIPESRRGDVIVFDPSDEGWPVGLNVLSATSEVEKNLLASDTVAMFERLATSWGDTMTTVLANAIQALLSHPEAWTLVDLRRLLVDERFRQELLAGVADHDIHFFWEKEYPLIGARAIGPILTRLDTFLRSRLIRNIVGQRAPRLSIPDVLANRKILLCKLSQGLIGIENAALLGSLVVTKLHQAALARQQVPQSARTPFFAYLDEFQHFVTPSIAALLSEGRKYGVGLVMAHQSLDQLKGSPGVESAVLGNAYTRIVFRVGDSDAKRLAEGFAHFEVRDLQDLARGEAIVRVGTARSDFNLRTFPPEERDEADTIDTREAIISLSRERYAIAKADVEHALAPAAPASSTVVPISRDDSASPAEREDESAHRVAPVPIKRSAESVRKVATPPKDLGKGGQEHKYLQYLVKRLAEERGFRAVIEENIGEGRSVDVLLRRDDLTIACEISVSTEIDHELANIEKCGALGCTRILFISASKRKRAQVQKRIRESLLNIPIAAIAPEEFVAALDDLASDVRPSEQLVRGYKVKVKRTSIAYEDLASRRSAVAGVIARSLRSPPLGSG